MNIKIKEFSIHGKGFLIISDTDRNTTNDNHILYEGYKECIDASTLAELFEYINPDISIVEIED